MDWYKLYPFKWQVVNIALGLCGVVCAGIFLLISVGLSDVVWRILAGISACIGVICILTGTIWCCKAVNKTRLNPELYVSQIKDKDYTWATEAT